MAVDRGPGIARVVADGVEQQPDRSVPKVEGGNLANPARLAPHPPEIASGGPLLAVAIPLEPGDKVLGQIPESLAPSGLEGLLGID